MFGSWSIFDRRAAGSKMYPQPSVLVVALAAVVSAGAVHSGRGPLSLQTTDPQIFCGRNLAKALAVLCADDTSGSKRSGYASMYDAILTPQYNNGELQPGWWVGGHGARSLRSWGRVKRLPGVVNECCDKACSVGELLTYC